MSPTLADILYPVIIKTPAETEFLSGRDKVAALSLHARRALTVSVELSELVLESLDKDHRGAPQPQNGVYWSLSHKPGYAAAVCGTYPLGIDIEAVEPRREELFEYIAPADEWLLLGDKSWENFFRIFTAKEAVLKATGDGISGLSQCRLLRVINDDHLVMAYDGREWLIEHFRVGGHIASITAMDHSITWTVVGAGSELD